LDIDHSRLPFRVIRDRVERAVSPVMSAVPPIVLQKSFCVTEYKFSGPYARRSNNDLRDYIIPR
jgi:hypothetical protein